MEYALHQHTWARIAEAVSASDRATADSKLIQVFANFHLKLLSGHSTQRVWVIVAASNKCRLRRRENAVMSIGLLVCDSSITATSRIFHDSPLQFFGSIP